jgi:hypothetical protein
MILQNSGNQNSYAEVDGYPQVGSQIVMKGYSGAPAQEWTAAQYPGSDLTNSDGVVFALYKGGDAPLGLVITAGDPGQPVTLQQFEVYNLNQLWSYAKAGSALVSLSTGYVLDADNGGTLKTWSAGPAGNSNQQWTFQADADAAQVAPKAEAKEALAAAG